MLLAYLVDIISCNSTAWLIFCNLAVTLCAVSFKIKTFYVLPTTCMYVLCVCVCVCVYFKNKENSDWKENKC